LLHRDSAISKYLRLIFNNKPRVIPKAVPALRLPRAFCFAELPGVRFHRRALRYAFFLLLLILYALPLPPANASVVTLGWDSNPEPDLEGYVIYRNAGSPGPPYKYSDEVPEDDLADPLHPKTTLTGLKEGEEYYIALTAYNSEGVESSFSNDLCIEVVNNTAELCSTSASSVTSSDSGSGSGGGSNSSNNSCFISTASQIPPTNYSLFLALLIPALIAIGRCRQKKSTD